MSLLLTFSNFFLLRGWFYLNRGPTSSVLIVFPSQSATPVFYCSFSKIVGIHDSQMFFHNIDTYFLSKFHLHFQQFFKVFCHINSVHNLQQNMSAKTTVHIAKMISCSKWKYCIKNNSRFSSWKFEVWLREQPNSKWIFFLFIIIKKIYFYI